MRDLLRLLWLSFVVGLLRTVRTAVKAVEVTCEDPLLWSVLYAGYVCWFLLLVLWLFV